MTSVNRARARRLFWAAAALLAAGPAAAQGTAAPAAPAAPACPASGTEMKTAALFGPWQARFDDLPAIAELQLAKHPEYDGVRGTATRAGVGGASAQVSQVAGDIGEDGMLNLDESLDGHAISGVWLGKLEPDSCGKVWKGIWRNALDDSQHNFTLTRTGTNAGSTSPP